MTDDGDNEDPCLIRVLLVEDNDLARTGLVHLLNSHADIEVIANTATIAEAIGYATALLPDIAVIDLQLPDGNGLDLSRRLQAISPTTYTIIHTNLGIDPNLATTAGATAIVLKQLIGNHLIDTIRAITSPDRG